MKAAKQKSLADLFDDFAPGKESQFFSVGYCCQLMQITPGQLRVLMEATATRFAECRDGVAYVDGAALVNLMCECKKCRDEIEAAANAVSSN